MFSRKIILFTVLIFNHVLLNAQCQLQDSVMIPDADSAQYIIDVSGIFPNDLSDPNISLCGVHVSFTHDNVSDWELFLSSPDGQLIQLLGPSGSFGRTDSTVWDIEFIPCSDAAMPDLGFLPRYAHDQPWGENGMFTGSYHPNDGCLEDFNTGPVNGYWTLFVSDVNALDVGSILSVSLDFCEEIPECNACLPEAGRDLGVLQACEGDPSLRFAPMSQGIDSSYSHEYLVVESGIIRDIVSGVDLRDSMPGTWFVCGLSFADDDRDELEHGVIGSRYRDFLNDVNGKTPSICADPSDRCMRVVIDPQPEDVFVFDTICPGASFMYGDSVFTSGGIYDVIFQTETTCERREILELYSFNFSGSLSGDRTIQCRDTIADILFSGPDRYTGIIWRQNGAIIARDTQAVAVAMEGLVSVSYNQFGCRDTLFWDVANTIVIPELSIENDTINCSEPNVRLATTSSTAITWEWFLNNQFLSSQQNPVVDNGGNYKVIISDRNGCQDSTDFVITVDTLIPATSVVGGALNCTPDDLFMSVQTSRAVSFDWRGPSGFRSNQQNPLVIMSGNYSVLIQYENGCERRYNAEVTDNPDLFSPVFSIAEIDCDELTVTHSVSSEIAQTSVYWVPPSGDTLRGLSINSSESGRFDVRLTSPDGCFLDTFINVNADLQTPQITITGDTIITCDNQPVLLDAQSDITPVEWFWLFPDSTSDINAQITASLSGWYYVQATRPNGCFTLDSLYVGHGDDVPEINIINEIFTCTRDTVIIEALANELYTYSWQDANGGVIGNTQNISVFQPGIYYVDVRDQLGCTARYFTRIVADFTSPTVIRPLNDTLTCNDPMISVSPETSSIYRSINWLRNGSFLATADTLRIEEPGTYRYNIVFNAFCELSGVFDVSIDTIRPTINILPSEMLTCNTRFVDLIGTSDEMANYRWLRNGNILITDSVTAVSVAGNYIFQSFFNNGCIAMDSIHIMQDTLGPRVQVFNDSITCAEGKLELQVQLENASLDTLEVSWTGPDNFMSDIINPLVTDTGEYILTISDPQGCETIISAFILLDKDPLTVEALGGHLSCRDSTETIRAIAASPQTTLQWFGPNNFTSTQAFPLVRDTGNYVLIARGGNGCVARDTVFVGDDPLFPDADLALDVWTCSSQEISVEGFSSDTSAIYRWISDNQSDTIQGQQVFWPYADTLRLEVEGLNGCITGIDTLMAFDTIAPEIELFTNDLVVCEQLEVLLQSTIDLNDNYSIVWSTETGTIINISNDEQSARVSGLSSYIAELINNNNGCIGTDTLLLEQSEETLTGFILDIQDASCENNGLGQISIDDIIGGFGSVDLTIDGEQAGAVRQFIQLSPATYLLSAKDSLGCVIDSLVDITDTSRISGWILSDTIIEYPNQIQMDLNQFIEDTSGVSVLWTGEGLSCTDCFNPVINPSETQTYCAELRLREGCAETYCFEVAVNNALSLYLPNVFTPNGDDQNDIWRIESAEPITVLSMDIFDRWGNLLYHAQDAAHDAIQWDGHFNGVALTSQVVVYRLRYLDRFGRLAKVSGDITILN